MKISLRPNLRYFEHDDTDFYITAGEVKELPEKHLRSYSIKHYLFSGKFQVEEGFVLLNIKSALVYISPEGLYAKEFGKYFTKDLEFNTITWLTEDQLPSNIKAKLNQSASAELKPVKPIEKVEEKVVKQSKKLLKKVEKEEPKKSFSSKVKNAFELKSIDEEENIDFEDPVEVAKKTSIKKSKK